MVSLVEQNLFTLSEHLRSSWLFPNSRGILQRESQTSQVYKQTKSVNNRKTVKTVMTLTWYSHFERNGQSQTQLDLFWLTVGIPSSDIENLIFVPCYVFSLRHINMNAIVEYFISHHILA